MKKLLLIEFWWTLMISDPYENFEKDKLEENGCNKEIGIAQNLWWKNLW
jgi:hypothetical protein